MKIVEILLELPEVRVGTGRREREEDKAIKREDKSSKGLLITLIRIRAEESITCLSGTMQDNSAKTTTRTPLFKSLIRFALILPVVVMIKFVSDPLPSPASGP